MHCQVQTDQFSCLEIFPSLLGDSPLTHTTKNINCPPYYLIQTLNIHRLKVWFDWLECGSVLFHDTGSYFILCMFKNVEVNSRNPGLKPTEAFCYVFYCLWVYAVGSHSYNYTFSCVVRFSLTSIVEKIVCPQRSSLHSYCKSQILEQMCQPLNRHQSESFTRLFNSQAFIYNTFVKIFLFLSCCQSGLVYMGKLTRIDIFQYSSPYGHFKSGVKITLLQKNYSG